MPRSAPTLASLLLALSVLALSGCAEPGAGQAVGAGGGGDDAVGSSTSGATPDALSPVPGATTPSDPTTPAAASARPVPAQLTVTVDDGAGTVTASTLTCQPAGGDHPDTAGACAGIAAAGGAGAFAPADPALACTEIYGGPQTATVTGTVDGTAVDASFSRANGCEIARWDALVGLLGEAGAF